MLSKVVLIFCTMLISMFG